MPDGIAEQQLLRVLVTNMPESSFQNAKKTQQPYSLKEAATCQAND